MAASGHLCIPWCMGLCPMLLGAWSLQRYISRRRPNRHPRPPYLSPPDPPSATSQLEINWAGGKLKGLKLTERTTVTPMRPQSHFISIETPQKPPLGIYENQFCVTWERPRPQCEPPVDIAVENIKKTILQIKQTFGGTHTFSGNEKGKRGPKRSLYLNRKKRPSAIFRGDSHWGKAHSLRNFIRVTKAKIHTKSFY